MSDASSYPPDVQAILARYDNELIPNAVRVREGLTGRRVWNQPVAKPGPAPVTVRPSVPRLNVLEKAILTVLIERGGKAGNGMLYNAMPSKAESTHRSAVGQIKKVLNWHGIPFIDNRHAGTGSFFLLDIERARALL